MSIQKTVQAQILIAINPSGHWCCVGHHLQNAEGQTVGKYLEGGITGPHTFIPITVNIGIPAIDVEFTEET